VEDRDSVLSPETVDGHPKKCHDMESYESCRGQHGISFGEPCGHFSNRSISPSRHYDAFRQHERPPRLVLEVVGERPHQGPDRASAYNQARQALQRAAHQLPPIVTGTPHRVSTEDTSYVERGQRTESPGRWGRAK